MMKDKIKEELKQTFGERYHDGILDSYKSLAQERYHTHSQAMDYIKTVLDCAYSISEEHVDSDISVAGQLDSTGHFSIDFNSSIWYKKGEDKAQLEGEFTPEQLTDLVSYMTKDKQ